MNNVIRNTKALILIMLLSQSLLIFLQTLKGVPFLMTHVLLMSHVLTRVVFLNV